jgi:(2Fe-2S) ferredoxin
LDELNRQHLSNDYQLTSTGCLGPCACGTTVLTYPDGTVYGGVTPADVAEIVAQHLIAGKPVLRLVVPD